MFLLLKARIAGGAGGDLLDTTVQVAGFTTKHGTYVAPHTAIRHKRPAEAPAAKPAVSKPAAQSDLFSVDAPAHAVHAPHAQADLFAQPAPKPKPKPDPAPEAKPAVAPPAEADAEPAPERQPDPAAPAVEAKISQWAVPPGTKPGERRQLNAAALALLKAKTDDEMTAADRDLLARYTGRGGIGDSLNEFYTDPDIASAMWSLLANAGFKGGEVLEPSCGTGVFLHTAPEGVRVTGVELDGASGRIASILHKPAGHEVHVSSMERFATQDGRLFDAVIGNVPFGIRGSHVLDDKIELSTCEDYFVDTSLDKTRDGGLVALIVPTGVMNRKSGRAFRERLLRKGEFLGARRMPNTAFASSHTDVTTDILLFRKRPAAAAGALSTLSQDEIRELGVWDDEFLAGTYFEGRGAEHVYGTVGTSMRSFGEIYAVTGSMQGVPEAIASSRPEEPAPTPTMAAILEALPDDAARQRAISASLRPSYIPAQIGDIKVVDGSRYILQGEPPRWHLMEAQVPSAVSDAAAIAEELERLTAGGTLAPRARADLIDAMDSYVKLHGVPARNKDLAQWLSAPFLPRDPGFDLTQAEHARAVDEHRRRVARLLGAVNSDGSYSDMVTGETRNLGAASMDTVATKMALELGGFSVDQLAAALGRADGEAILDHLYASPAYAMEPDGKWTTLESYISGDLWPKLDAARALMSRSDITQEARAKYTRQAEELEAAIAPQSLDDVEVMLSSGFVTPEDITAFFDTKVGTHADAARAVFTFADSVWKITKERVHGGTGWSYAPHDSDLALRFLNRDGFKKKERDELEELNKEFRDWLLTSDRREAVEDRYNRTYRGFVARVYSEAPIAIPGLNPPFQVNDYHWSGLRWALEAGKGIIADDVGLGKTGRGMMLAALAKATGHAKRPTFVVPKTVLANWVSEAETWFPGSRVLVIGETYGKNAKGERTVTADDAAARRAKFQAMRQNDYDFVFMSQPVWNELDVDPITKGEYANQDFWAQRGDQLGSAGDKRLNEIRSAYEQALAKRDFRSREETVYFNDLGIDMLIMDEGHAYKNLFAARNRMGENPKFLGGSGLSKRAQDTFFKTKWLRERNGGRGVYMLTATPTKNSPLEVYSMLMHIAPEAFERMGIKNAEEFLDRFCEFETDTILDVTGEIKEALITAGFKNLSELREVMRRYIARRTAQDVGLKLPTPSLNEHLIDMTDDQTRVYEGLRQEFKDCEPDATGESHPFSIMDRMGKASLDLSLLGWKGTRSPKIEKLAANVKEFATEGGQVIFCESVPTHEKIVQALVEAGIPRKEIGVINADVAKSSDARQKISEQFNAGKLKVVIGNKAMEEGINLQKTTSDIHHLDTPWNPASMQQRNGRGVRQGNKRESIRLHTYLAKGSFDGYRWQTVAAKRNWLDLLWGGGDRVENLARDGAFSREDMLIMMSANPEAERKKLLENKAAAEAAAEAKARSDAAADFVRFKELKRTAAKMKEAGRKGPSYARLKVKIDAARTSLRANKAFAHKEALDADGDALMEPVTGHLWQAGKAFEMDGSDKQPINWSSEPSRWVVTSVDMSAGTINARPYASLTGMPVTINVADMSKGLSPFEYSKEAEDAALSKYVEGLSEAQKKSAERDAEKAVDQPTWESIQRLPPEMVERYADVLQHGLKEAVRAYKDGGHHRTFSGMLGPNGPELAHSYEMRSKLDTHDLMLPGHPAHRAKAIDAYVNLGLGRKTETRYQESSRRRVGYGDRKAIGVRPAYEGYEHDSNVGWENPWARVLRDFGHGAQDEAEAELRRRVIANIEGAPDFREAMAAAQPGLDLTMGTPENRWPKPIVRALRAAAEKHGVMDKPLREAAPSSGRAYRPGINPDVYKLNHWEDSERQPVRTFLERLPGGKDDAPAPSDAESEAV